MLDKSHPCSQIHGHNYMISFHLKSETLDANGFVRDYKSLQFVKEYIDSEFDHKHLNDVMPNHPTSENLAAFLYYRFKPEIPELYAIGVSETPLTSCIYEPECQ